MKGKLIAAIGVPVVLLLIIVWVAVTAAGVGGEASSLKDFLDQSVKQRTPAESVKTKLTSLGYSLDPPSSGAMTGTGQKHSLLVYVTWLTVRVSFNPDGEANGYHIDRADHWF